MKKSYLLVILLAINYAAFAQETVRIAVHSAIVNDSFDIYLTSTRNITAGNFTRTVYYTDANFKSGKNLRRLVSQSTDTSLKNCLFIGIANRGRLHKYRRRDYIPPIISEKGIIESKVKNYGHADHFYSFLKTELVPLIESRYHATGTRSLLGHSYGGVFILYCVFTNDGTFQNFISLSPAIWVNKSNIFGYEEKYWRTHSELNKYLYLSVGTREFFNLIRHGTRKMNRLLLKRNYSGFIFEYKEWKGKTHESQVPRSMEYLLSHHKI
jgi:predicted alpha/beta superfamily hydrolase